MTDILVELEFLGGLIKSLATSAEHISGATAALKSVSASDLGSDDLDSAVSDFQDRWETGIKKISEASHKITDELRSAKQTYESIEQEAKASLERLLGEQGAASASSGGAPGGGGQAPTQSKIGKALEGMGL